MLNELRQRVDALLDDGIERFYTDIPYGKELKEGSARMSVDYFKRHTIEIILRLRMKRTIDALTIHYFTKHDPKIAKKWAEYTADEMLHDAWFGGDLNRLGVTNETIYSTEPYFTTKLLQGYFYYGLEHEGYPLASLCSSYLIEYMSLKTQPLWLSNFREHLGGADSVKGSLQHVEHDVDDDHLDFVWEVIERFVVEKGLEDKVFAHFRNLIKLFYAFYTELYSDTVGGQAASVGAAVAPELVVLAS